MASKSENVRSAIKAIDAKIARLEYRRGELQEQAERLESSGSLANRQSTRASRQNVGVATPASEGHKTDRANVLAERLAESMQRPDTVNLWSMVINLIPTALGAGIEPTDATMFRKSLPASVKNEAKTLGIEDTRVEQVYLKLAPKFASGVMRT